MPWVYLNHLTHICLFFHRIAKYSACSKECFVLALVYIDRIIQNNHNFTVNSLNVHRILITRLVLIQKASWNDGSCHYHQLPSPLTSSPSPSPSPLSLFLASVLNHALAYVLPLMNTCPWICFEQLNVGCEVFRRSVLQQCLLCQSRWCALSRSELSRSGISLHDQLHLIRDSRCVQAIL